jgi:ATP-dependent RNA helicase DeaD
MDSFRKLGLSEEIIQTLKDAGFKKPSEIQDKALPLVVAGHDVIGSAATGSGKTLAFGAPILDKIHKNPNKGIQALIVTPTRELSEQNMKSLMRFGRYLKVSVAAIYGGVSYEPQMHALKHADIIVGTPGRLLDHLQQGTLNLKNVKFLVLDEADRMLDMGFIDDITTLIKACPTDRQTLLFSATMSPDISHIAQRYMRNPQEVGAVAQVDPLKLKQIFYDVPQDMKFSMLVHLLKHEHQELVMVFCNTRRNADIIARNLNRYKIHALAIHGGLSQNKRNNTMEQFRSKDIRVLVCTDVAARGLDIKGVSHVYNYDIPKTSKEYIHRIGRTARAGKDGIAVNIVARNDYINFKEVLSDDAIKIERIELPEIEKVSVSFREETERGRFGQRGRSFGGGGRGYSRGGGERSFGRRDGERRGYGRGRDEGRGGGRRFSRPRSEGSGRSFGGRGGSSFGRGRRY